MSFPNYGRPNLTALRLQVRAVFAAKMTGADMTLRRSVLGVIADAIAGLINLLFGYLDYIAGEVFASTADWDGLLVQGAEYGLAPQPAVAAAGNVVLSGIANTPANAGILLQGNVVVAGVVTPVQVATTAPAVLTGGTATVAAVATTPGSIGNLAANAPLTLVNAVSGVNAAAAVDGNGFAGGLDGDSAADPGPFRARILARKQKPPQGGAANDYQTWAMECATTAGVTRAWALPLNRGPGTVDVAFVCDNQTPITPTTGQIATVQAYIGLHVDANGNAIGRPVTDDCVVFAPIASPVAFNIHGLVASQQAAVTAALADLMSQTVLAGGLSFQDQIVPAVAAAAAGNAFTVTAPAADVPGATGTLLTLGAVTFV